ncbi:MAG: hypothetical protein MUP14_04225 [Dehalococcoidia bacterium]|nr:hypothetical protein [Dehalococcoidia bacterium]
MQKWMCSVATAHGAVGVKTNIGAIIPPPWAKKIKAVWCNTLVGAVLATAESVGGILELDGTGIESQAFPIDQENMLTGGDAHLPAHIIPVDIPCSPLAQVMGATTMDDTVTAAVLNRWGCCFEG